MIDNSCLHLIIWQNLMTLTTMIDCVVGISIWFLWIVLLERGSPELTFGGQLHFQTPEEEQYVCRHQSHCRPSVVLFIGLVEKCRVMDTLRGLPVRNVNSSWSSRASHSHDRSAVACTYDVVNTCWLWQKWLNAWSASLFDSYKLYSQSEEALSLILEDNFNSKFM